MIQNKKKKPVLIAIGGMSGSGKSTLAKAVAEAIPDALWLDSDRVRKEIFGIPHTEKLPEEAYGWGVTEQLIHEMDRRISNALTLAKTVVVSSTFLDPRTRTRHEKNAEANEAEFHGFFLQTDIETLFKRVAERKNDASDATESIVQNQYTAWSKQKMDWDTIDAGQDREEVLRLVLSVLRVESSCALKPPAPK